MEYLLKASGIIAIFYGFYKIVLQRETFFQSNRWFLLIGIIIALTLPYITIPIYAENTPQSLQGFTVLNSASSVIEENTINWLDILSYIYVLGVAFLSGKLILNLISLGNLIMKHPIEKTDNYSLIPTNKDIAPFSFFNFIVFNPNLFDEKELDQIIIHEKVHAFQFHSIDIILTQLASILFWFNPFIWLYKKELTQNLEFIADDRAQKESICKKNYQLLLLRTSMPKNQMALTNNFYNSLIKKRIIMLHKNRSKNTSQWKFALIFPLIIAFIFTFNTKVVSQNYKVKENKIHEVNEDIQMVLITKDSDNKSLDRIKKDFSKEGVKVKFSGIKRNNKEEITAIKIDVNSKQSNANYNIGSLDPIKPIKISFDNEGGNIAIGNSNIHYEKGYSFISKDGNHKVVKGGKGNQSFVFVSKDSKHVEHEVIDIKDEGTFVIKKDGEGNIHHKSDDNDHDIIFISEDGDKKVIEIKTDGENNWIDKKDNVKVEFVTGSKENILYIIDGKETNKKALEELNPDEIKEMNVLKGESAKEKYGEKGKDGVILITTKKK